jgi:pSer/pThr/pTyr-binding forkhead associated (FHA) protein
MLRLIISEGPMKDKTFVLRGKTVFIGRSSRNDIQINDVMVSRKHLKVFNRGNACTIEDLRSTNGTELNGNMITPGETYEVTERDTIVIGNTLIQLRGLSTNKSLSKIDLALPSFKAEADGLNTLARERRSRSSKNLKLIYKASEFLEMSLDINEMLEKILDSLLDTLPRIDGVAVLQFDKDTNKAKEVIARSRQDKIKERIRYSQTVLDRVAKDGKAVKVSNTTYDAQSEYLESMDTLQIRSVLCAPMIINAKVSGAIYADSLRGPYDNSRKEDLLLLNSLSGFIAAAMEKSNLTAK